MLMNEDFKIVTNINKKINYIHSYNIIIKYKNKPLFKIHLKFKIVRYGMNIT